MEDKNMRIIEFIAQILGGLSAVVCILKLLYELILFFTKKRYIKNLFVFDKKECYISQAIYKKEATKADYDYVTIQSVSCIQKIQYLLNEVGYKLIPFTESYVGKNIIHIGGPSANKSVNSIFVTKHYNFTIILPASNEDRLKKLGMNTSCYEFTPNGDFKFKIGEEHLNLDEKIDYGIFIRIPRCRKDGIDYTTHIIFGGWANGTLAAVDFFTRNYKMIAKKFKKERYCFAIPISRINNSTELLRVEDIKDLTANFFGEA